MKNKADNLGMFLIYPVAMAFVGMLFWSVLALTLGMENGNLFIIGGAIIGIYLAFRDFASLSK